MNAQEFVDNLKENGTVYTHGGNFHGDDVATTALINLFCDKEGIDRPDVQRVFSVPEDAKGIVYDIGFGEFDHHQSDNGFHENKNSHIDSCFEKAEDIPYAAFGKVWDCIKDRFCDGNEKMIELFEKNFVEPIDLCDNTRQDCSFSAMVRDSNINWNEKGTSDEAFAKIVGIAEKGISYRLDVARSGQDVEMAGLTNDDGGCDTKFDFPAEEKKVAEERREAKIESNREAEGIVKESQQDSMCVSHNDMPFKVFFLDKNIPFSTVRKNVDKDVTGYITAERGGYTLRIVDFSVQVPNDWRGAKSFDQPGLKFCAKTGVTMSFDTKENAEKGFERIIDENKEKIEKEEMGILKEDDSVKLATARDDETSPRTLAVLSRDENPDIRYSVSNNPNTPSSVIEKLTMDKDPDTRESALERYEAAEADKTTADNNKDFTEDLDNNDNNSDVESNENDCNDIDKGL